jgi:hypothetical protein
VHVSDPFPRPPSPEPSSAEPPTPDPPPSDDPTVVLNRLAQLALALIPAFIAALAAIGGATGGLARLLRDQPGVAVVAMGLVLLSLAFAALARAVSTSRTPGPSGVAPTVVVRPAVKAVLLFGSGLLLFAGLFIAVTAQIGVMSTSQAPQISGSVTHRGSDVVVKGEIKASGVRSVDRITIYSYQTNEDADSTDKPQLYQSSSGPDANGAVDVPLELVVHNGPEWPQLVVITAVLGEEKRNCDGRPVDPTQGDVAVQKVACLVLRIP